MKKILFNCLILPISLCNIFLITPAMADTGSDTGNSIVAAIRELGNRIEALAMAGAKSVTEMVHQADRYFSQNSTLLATVTQQSQTVQNQTTASTQREVTSALLAFPADALPANPLSNPILSNLKQQKNSLVDNLTVRTPASDTLYAGDLANAISSTSDKALQPTSLHNQYFNFDSLMAADQLNDQQQISANQFITYLTQNYQPLTQGIQFDAMLDQIQNFGTNNRKSAAYISKIINDPKYKNYQLSVRSLLAARSVALSNFNFLLQQRMPNSALNNTSPLQAQQALINNTVGNADWFKWIETNASPTSVAREQLFLTALMIKQLQQLNVYNQRLLATLSLLTVQNTATQTTSLQTQVTGINQLITGKDDSGIN